MGRPNGYGANYWNFSNVNNAGSYGSPPDPFGVGAVGLDQAGRPVYAGMNYSGTGTPYLGFGCGLNISGSPTPYELNLGPNVGPRTVQHDLDDAEQSVQPVGVGAAVAAL